jgi:hypothetical protein
MTKTRYAQPRGIRNVPEGLGEPLRDLLEQLRNVALATVVGDIARAQVADGTIPTSSGSAAGGGADLTPPPTPSGVTVVAGPDFVGIVTGAPVFTAGSGYGRTIVYGAKYSGTGPLPTFAAAVVVHEFVGQVGTFPTEPGTQWHIWTAWRSIDGVTSAAEGGVNGHQVTTGTDMSSVATALNGIVTPWLAASKILAGSLSVGEYIQSSGYAPGGSGFRIDGGGGVDIANVGRTRVLNLGATGAQPVLKAGTAFEILANGNATFSGVLTASNFYSSTSGKRIVINDANDNEIRFFGNRGDGVIEELANIGVKTIGPDSYVAFFGSPNSTRYAVYAQAINNSAVTGEAFGSGATAVQGLAATGVGVGGLSTSGTAVSGNSASGTGVNGQTTNGTAVRASASGSGRAVNAIASGSGVAVDASSSTGIAVQAVANTATAVLGQSISGYGGSFSGNASKSALNLTPVSALPSTAAVGDVILYNAPTVGYTLCWYSTNGTGGAGWYRPDSISLV